MACPMQEDVQIHDVDEGCIELYINHKYKNN